MGFGGGSFGGGSSSFDSGGSSFGGGGGSFGGGGGSPDDDEKTTAKDDCCVAVALLLSSLGLAAFVSFIIWLIFASPSYDYCINGDALNAKEQSWCMPNKSSSVMIDTKLRPYCTSFYRVKRSELPKVSHRYSKVDETMKIYSEGYKYYSFVMMPGGNVTATIESSDSDDMCYLLKYKDFEDFRKSQRDSGFKYEKKGKGTLKTVFKPTVGDTYYFAVAHRWGPKATATFDMEFFYAVYNLSSEHRVHCSSSKTSCELNDTKSDELIIADNPGNDECRAELLIPGSPSAGLIAGVVIFVIPFYLLSCCFGLCSFDRFNSFRSKRAEEKTETGSLLAKETQTTGTPFSTNTPESVEETPSGPSAKGLHEYQELPYYSS